MGALLRNGVLWSLAVGLAAAFLWPAGGMAAQPLLPALVVVIFLAQGLGLTPGERPRGRALWRLGLWALVVSQLLGPVAGWLLAQAHAWPVDHRVGLLLFCCTAPPLVSATLLAQRADGDPATAIMLGVGLNLVMVFIYPWNLSWTLGESVELDPWTLWLQLVVLVLLPAVVGHGLRRGCPRRVEPWLGWVDRLNILAMGGLMYLSCSPETSRLDPAGLGEAVPLACAAGVFNLGLTAVAFLVARRGLGLAERVSRSLAMVASQRSLSIAVAAWTLSLASRYPGAVLVPVVFFICQASLGGVLAAWWAGRPARALAPAG